MDARVPILALLAAATVAVALTPTLTSDRVQLSDHPSDADRVVLYENGIAAIILGRNFTATGAEQVLIFTVPQTTLLDSIRIEGDGVEVREFRTTLTPRSIVGPGDLVTAHAGDAKYRGTVLSFSGGRLLLAAGNDTVVVEQHALTALEVHGQLRHDAPEGSASVSVRVVAAAGNRSVTLSYLAQGAGWTPSYIFDAETGNTTLFATLTAITDWTDVHLQVVAGSPSMVYERGGRDGMYDYDMRLTMSVDASAGSAAGDGFSESQALGELHRYTYGRPLSVARDEVVRLPLMSGQLPIVRHYFQAHASGYETLVALSEVYQVENTFKDPMPDATARVFLGEDWIASVRMPQLAPGEQGNITVAVSSEVKLQVQHPVHDTKVLEEPSCNDQRCKPGRSRDTDEYVLTVRNRKDAGTVDLRILFTPDYDATTKVIAPSPDERHDRTLVWNAKVDAGSKAVFEVETERTYST